MVLRVATFRPGFSAEPPTSRPSSVGRAAGAKLVSVVGSNSTGRADAPILRLKCFHPPKRDNWPTRSHDWVDKYQVRRAASNNGIK